MGIHGYPTCIGHKVPQFAKQVSEQQNTMRHAPFVETFCGSVIQSITHSSYKIIKHKLPQFIGQLVGHIRLLIIQPKSGTRFSFGLFTHSIVNTSSSY